MNGSASVDAVKATMVTGTAPAATAAAAGASTGSTEKKEGSPAASPTAKPGEEEVDPEVELAAQQLKEARIDKENALDNQDAIELGLHSGEVKVTGIEDVAAMYKSAKAFSDLGLAKPYLDALAKMNWQRPSSIQAQALPYISRGLSIVGQAHHGSGKTGTYALGMLSRIDPAIEKPQAICLAPTRELAIQIADVVRKISQFSKVKVDMVLRGFKGRATGHILVGTPGTVMAKIQSKELETSAIKLYVLDEADNLVGGQGVGVTCSNIKKACPANVQTLLFSATFSDRVRALANKVSPNAVRIELKKEELTLTNVVQFHLPCEDADGKLEWLGKLYTVLTLGQSIIFCNSIANAKTVYNYMRSQDHEVSITYGSGMDDSKRDQEFEAFRTGKTTVLITTNLLARGVDVITTSVVVNYDLPETRFGKADTESYIHRVHRTGRFGRKGGAINLTHNAQTRGFMKEIEAHFAHKCIVLPEDVDKIEAQVRAALEGKPASK